jgi:TetR/AcrR family transcriptional repressor of mexJK operon
MRATAAIRDAIRAGARESGAAAPTAGESKEQAIVRAAAEVFLRRGYGRASMDAIARRAEVSKQTIYHHFGSKEALFGAIVEARCAQLLGPPDTPDPAAGDLETALTTLGRQFLALVLEPPSLALHRLIVAEAARFPELGRAVYEAGPRIAVRRLAGLFEREARRGTITVADPELAAEQFFGALIGHLQLRALLRVEDPQADDRVEASVAAAVRAFLAAHRKPVA